MQVIKLSTLISILLSSERDVFLNFSSFHNVLKSMTFVSGGVQNDVDSKHFLRQSSISSWILLYLITSLSMQALAKSNSCDQTFFT